MKKILVLFAIVGMISCETINEEPNDYTSISQSNITIIPFNELENCFRTEKSSTLTNIELEAVNQLLLNAINQYNKDNIQTLIHIDRYKFQYTPVVNTFNDKVIWVNAFKKSNVKDWKTEAVVQRGVTTNDFFTFSINLSKGTHSKLRTNI